MKYKYKNNGSALIFALVTTSVVTIILVSLVQYVTSQMRYGTYTVKREQALHVAEAGVNFYRWYVAHQVNGKTAQEVEDFWENGNPYGVASPYEADYEGIGHYSISVTPPDEGFTNIIVEATGWMLKDPSVKRTIRVRFRRPPWCEYAIFSDSNLHIEDGENVNGKVHANGGIHFDGVAQNTVSSAKATYFDDDTGQDEDGVWTSWSGEYNSNMGENVFVGGKSFPVPEEDFDSVLVSFSLMFDKAEELNFAYGPPGRGHQIILKYDKVDIYKVIQEDNGIPTIKQPVALNVDLPDVAVIYVDKSTWVEGTLGSGKKLSIGSTHADIIHGDVFLYKDILYEDYNSGTVLGIITKNNIQIAEDSEDDLRIDAALVSQTGGITREYTDSKSNITIYGAIVVRGEYGFQGYQSRNIIYDNSLIYNPPPYFPTKSSYEMDMWEEI